MLAPVSQYARPLSTRCKEQSSRPQFLCQLQFHWHKLGHAQSSKQCNQSKTSRTSNRGPAWSNKCTCQTSSICSLTETWQEDGQATVHVCSSPKINNLRSSDWSKGLKKPSLPFFLPSLLSTLFFPPLLPSLSDSLPPSNSCSFPSFLPSFLYSSIHPSSPLVHLSFLPSIPYP